MAENKSLQEKSTNNFFTARDTKWMQIPLPCKCKLRRWQNQLTEKFSTQVNFKRLKNETVDNLFGKPFLPVE